MAKLPGKQPYNPFAELAEIREHKGESPSTQVPESLGVPAPRRLAAKSQDPAFVKLTAYVPKHLHRAAKARLVEQGREMSDLVEELVSDWLQKQSSPSS